MRTKKSLGSAVRISTRIHHVAPIDGKESADKRGAAKARLAGVKRPSLSSNPKGTRDLIMHGQWVLEKPALLSKLTVVTVDGIMENTGNISMTYDGTWVAHPDLVPVAKEVFDRMMPQHSRRQALQKWHNALQSIGQTR